MKASTAKSGLTAWSLSSGWCVFRGSLPLLSVRDAAGLVRHLFSSVHPGYVRWVEATRQAQRAANGNGERVDLLERDSEFARLIRSAEGARPLDRLWASAQRLNRGPWQPAPKSHGGRLGYLVLDGLLGRRVVVPERGRSLELLGAGDLFSPWQEDSPSFSQVAWTVIEPTWIAALDQSFEAQVREVPELLQALTDRALRRSRRIAVSAAIANTVGVEERLLLLLWQLTELWGRKAQGGPVLPYRLSHQTLADLVGARRPTVTLALRGLSDRGLLERGPAGEWILLGDPP
jgi:CRP/FNR family transcriptional regulator, cyclic AMP receptor protein